MPVDTLDFRGTRLHLQLQAGDDARARFTFGTDITGWSAWFAQVRSTTTTWAWTIDATQQASGIIVARLSAAQTTAMYGQEDLRWQFQALDDTSDTKTLFSGFVTVDKDEAIP